MGDFLVELIKSLLTGGSFTYGVSIYHIMILLIASYRLHVKYVQYKSEYSKNWQLRKYIAKYSPFIPMKLDIVYSDRFTNNPEAFDVIRNAVREAIVKGLNYYDDKYVGKRYGFSIPETVKPFKLRLTKTSALSKHDREVLKELMKEMKKMEK